MNLSRPVKQVIIIRKDLKMRRGKEISQGSHASGSFMSKLIQVYLENGTMKVRDEEIIWMQNKFTKICLRVDSEKELLKVLKLANEAGLSANLITDAGLTDAGNGKGNPTNTCIAIGPNYSDEIDKITGRDGSHPCKLY